MDKNMEKDFSYGKMVLNMRVNSLITIYMVMANTHGLMVNSSKENGLTIK